MEYSLNLAVLGIALLVAFVLAVVRVVRYFWHRRQRLEARAMRRAAARWAMDKETKCE